jgi:hypothetical protein
MQRPDLFTVIASIRDLKSRHAGATKADVEAALEATFGIEKNRSVYPIDDGALRISEANTGSFSNVVLSLSALRKYDKNPFVVVVVRPGTVEFLLANTSFLKKISHSSHQLRIDNVKGSFLGHDILREFDDLANMPVNFDALFALHRQVSWDENLTRLVEATNAIVPTGRRFVPTESQRATILSAPLRAVRLLESQAYRDLSARLSRTVRSRTRDILTAASIDNINLRGNAIEQIITNAGNFHSIDDLKYTIQDFGDLHVDIKTKLLNKSASPKLYNIDKMLDVLSGPNTFFDLLLVGIDTDEGLVSTKLVSMFDPCIIAATRIQFHWAGRASRGVTQLTNDVTRCFEKTYIPTVDVAGSQSLLKRFLDL